MEESDNLELVSRASEIAEKYAANAGRYLENEIGQDNLNVSTIAAFGGIASIGIFGTTYGMIRAHCGVEQANRWLIATLEHLSNSFKNLKLDCSISILIKGENGEAEN
jgi:hypothetical protein